jgi:hypothetical protein
VTEGVEPSNRGWTVGSTLVQPGGVLQDVRLGLDIGCTICQTLEGSVEGSVEDLYMGSRFAVGARVGSLGRLKVLRYRNS